MMLKLAKMFALTCALLAAASAAQAQTTHAATIDDAAWLAGRWVGEGLGGQLEETWSPPAGGQMVGHFAMSEAGAPRFYEFMMLDVVDGGIRMRVKHFNPDMTGWEEKDAWHTFEPVSATADALAFNGLVIRRVGADVIEMQLQMHSNGAVHQETLRFHRAPL
jgi:hypothetical protein